MNALFLALAYLRHHWARSVTLICVAALIMAVPLVARDLLGGSQRALTTRADSTPLVLGHRGSQLDLAMTALYFAPERTPPVTMAAVNRIWDSDLALPIPIHAAYASNGAPIIGTSLDYFDFRGLTLASGRSFAVLGEAVLGAAVADRLGLGPGDTVISTPENLFDLDGVYPLELQITGVLAPTATPDDTAIFVDVKTAWVIAGIGHGHEDVVTADAGATGNQRAAAALVQYNRITEDNIDSFHFHGADDSYPLSAVIVAPWDLRSGTILRGRFLDPENPLQLVEPGEVIGALVDRLFRIGALLTAVSALVGLAAFAAVGLALFLSWRLRAPELDTARRIGAGRWVLIRLAGTEIALILCAAVAVAVGLVLAFQGQGDEITKWLMAL